MAGNEILSTEISRLASNIDTGQRVLVEWDWVTKAQSQPQRVLKRENIKALTQAMVSRTSLALSLSGFGVESVQGVADLVKTVDCRELDLGFCRLGVDGSFTLLDELLDDSLVRYLDLSFNYVSSRTLRTLAAHMPKDLRVLSLRYNPITSDGLLALLNSARHVEILDVRCCGLYDSSAFASLDERRRAISDLLEWLRADTPSALHSLWLEGNGLTEAEEEDIVNAVIDGDREFKELCFQSDPNATPDTRRFSAVLNKYNALQRQGRECPAFSEDDELFMLQHLAQFERLDMGERLCGLLDSHGHALLSPLKQYASFYSQGSLKRGDTMPLGGIQGWGAHGAAVDTLDELLDQFDSDIDEEYAVDLNSVSATPAMPQLGTPQTCATDPLDRTCPLGGFPFKLSTTLPPKVTKIATHSLSPVSLSLGETLSSVNSVVSIGTCDDESDVATGGMSETIPTLTTVAAESQSQVPRLELTNHALDGLCNQEERPLSTDRRLTRPCLQVETFSTDGAVDGPKTTPAEIRLLKAVHDEMLPQARVERRRSSDPGVLPIRPHSFLKPGSPVGAGAAEASELEAVFQKVRGGKASSILMGPTRRARAGTSIQGNAAAPPYAPPSPKRKPGTLLTAEAAEQGEGGSTPLGMGGRSSSSVMLKSMTRDGIGMDDGVRPLIRKRSSFGIVQFSELRKEGGKQEELAPPTRTTSRALPLEVPEDFPSSPPKRFMKSTGTRARAGTIEGCRVATSACGLELVVTEMEEGCHEVSLPIPDSSVSVELPAGCPPSAQSPVSDAGVAACVETNPAMQESKPEDPLPTISVSYTSLDDIDKPVSDPAQSFSTRASTTGFQRVSTQDLDTSGWTDSNCWASSRCVKESSEVSQQSGLSLGELGSILGTSLERISTDNRTQRWQGRRVSRGDLMKALYRRPRAKSQSEFILAGVPAPSPEAEIGRWPSPQSQADLSCFSLPANLAARTTSGQDLNAALDTVPDDTPALPKPPTPSLSLKFPKAVDVSPKAQRATSPPSKFKRRASAPVGLMPVSSGVGSPAPAGSRGASPKGKKRQFRIPTEDLEGPVYSPKMINNASPTGVSPTSATRRRSRMEAELAKRLTGAIPASHPELDSPPLCWNPTASSQSGSTPTQSPGPTRPLPFRSSSRPRDDSPATKRSSSGTARRASSCSSNRNVKKPMNIARLPSPRNATSRASTSLRSSSTGAVRTSPSPPRRSPARQLARAATDVNVLATHTDPQPSRPAPGQQKRAFTAVRGSASPTLGTRRPRSLVSAGKASPPTAPPSAEVRTAIRRWDEYREEDGMLRRTTSPRPFGRSTSPGGVPTRRMSTPRRACGQTEASPRATSGSPLPSRRSPALQNENPVASPSTSPRPATQSPMLQSLLRGLVTSPRRVAGSGNASWPEHQQRHASPQGRKSPKRTQRRSPSPCTRQGVKSLQSSPASGASSRPGTPRVTSGSRNPRPSHSSFCRRTPQASPCLPAHARKVRTSPPVCSISPRRPSVPRCSSLVI